MTELPQIQSWELRARDLVKHRIKCAVIRNKEKAFTLANYQERMESFDKAISYCKEKESVPILDEIVSTLERFAIMQESIATKNYIGSVETDKYIAKNCRLSRENVQMGVILKERQELNRISSSTKGAKDKYIAEKLVSVKAEIVELSDDYVEFKELAYQGF